MPLADAVFYAQPVAGSTPAPRPDTRAVIDQVNKEFVPRVSIVQAGTSGFLPQQRQHPPLHLFVLARQDLHDEAVLGPEAAPVLFDKRSRGARLQHPRQDGRVGIHRRHALVRQERTRRLRVAARSAAR